MLRRKPPAYSPRGNGRVHKHATVHHKHTQLKWHVQCTNAPMHQLWHTGICRSRVGHRPLHPRRKWCGHTGVRLLNRSERLSFGASASPGNAARTQKLHSAACAHASICCPSQSLAHLSHQTRVTGHVSYHPSNIPLRLLQDPHPGGRREGRLRNACEVAGLGDSILILNVAPSRSLSEVDIFNLGCEKQCTAVIIQVAAVAWRRHPFQIVLPNCGTKRNRQTGRSPVCVLPLCVFDTSRCEEWAILDFHGHRKARSYMQGNACGDVFTSCCRPVLAARLEGTDKMWGLTRV